MCGLCQRLCVKYLQAAVCKCVLVDGALQENTVLRAAATPAIVTWQRFIGRVSCR